MFQLTRIMRTIIGVILGMLFLFPSISVQAQKSEAQGAHTVSPAALIGLPSATVTTESPGLVATKIVLARYTLPSPDPNLNDTFVIKMRITISENGEVETAKVIRTRPVTMARTNSTHLRWRRSGNGSLNRTQKKDAPRSSPPRSSCALFPAIESSEIAWNRNLPVRRVNRSK